MLAIVATVEHFWMYLVGGTFTRKTHHLPLVSIIWKPSSKLSAGLEHLSLRLQHYFNSEHIADQANPATYLSRQALPTNIIGPSPETSVTEEYVSFIEESAIPKALTVQEIERMHAEDAPMNFLIKALQTNNPKDLPRREIVTNWNNLCKSRTTSQFLKNDIVLRGMRLIIPKGAQAQIVCSTHRGNQGMVQT